MSTSPHVLLKADPNLEVDVTNDEADPSACHQLGQVSVLGKAPELPFSSFWFFLVVFLVL